MYTINKRIISALLLFSQLLTSCGVNVNLPSKQELRAAEEKAKPTPTQTSLNASSRAISEEENLSLLTFSSSNPITSEQTLTSSQVNFRTPSVISHALIADPNPSIIVSPQRQRMIRNTRYRPLKKESNTNKHSLQNKRLNQQPVAISPTRSSKLADESNLEELVITAKGGYPVKLYKVQGHWIATIEEKQDFLSRTLHLAIHIAPGFSLKDLFKHQQDWHQRYVQVVFPEKSPNNQGYLCIGMTGVVGGGGGNSKGSGGSRGGERRVRNSHTIFGTESDCETCSGSDNSDNDSSEYSDDDDCDDYYDSDSDDNNSSDDDEIVVESAVVKRMREARETRRAYEEKLEERLKERKERQEKRRLLEQEAKRIVEELDKNPAESGEKEHKLAHRKEEIKKAKRSLEYAIEELQQVDERIKKAKEKLREAKFESSKAVNELWIYQEAYEKQGKGNLVGCDRNTCKIWIYQEAYEKEKDKLVGFDEALQNYKKIEENEEECKKIFKQAKEEAATRLKELEKKVEEVKKKVEELDKPEKSYSMEVDGRELNPDNYVLNNPHMEENIIKLYKLLVEELGHANFQFQVTGGDRYEKDSKVYSRTNHEVIPNSSRTGAHMEKYGARAVDLRIRLADGSDIIPFEIVEKVVLKHKVLQFDPRALPHHYPDKHYHLQLPNTKEYGGGIPKEK